MEESKRLDNQNWFEKIESYLEKTMPDHEIREFEKELDQNMELRSLLEDQRLLTDAIETQSLNDFMDEVHEDLSNERAAPAIPLSRKLYKYLPIAASLVILMALSYFLTLGAGGNEKLFDEYFEPDPGLPTTMGAQEDYLLLRPMVFYKQGDYRKAIDEWTELHEQKTIKNDTLEYYLGLSHLALKDADEAISYLSDVAQASGSKYADKSNYFLGLAYLLKDDVDSAKKYLNLNQEERSSILLKELSD